VDFEQVADELYGLPPGEFVTARDERAAEARAVGDAELSAAIKNLRKPTTGAWLANLLVRERARDVEELVELGSLLRAAQDELAGDQLRQLSRRRHDLVVALGSEGLRLGRRAGSSVGRPAGDELERTLEAAMADPAAGAALRAGRLTVSLDYTGIGFEEVRSTPPSATRIRRGQRRPDERTDERGRRAAAVREVTSALQSAAKRVAAATKRAEDATDELRERQSALERARSEVRRLEHEVTDLDRRAAEARRQLRDAQEDERAARRQLKALEARGR
jgi:DNA repair exonuclease SbcCD ATPase subunit